MTLNVTILTPATIYQSADFRLTDNGKLVTNRSAKSVVLTYSTWIGFVTYTGLGRWHGKDLSDWVAEWLADGKQRSMAEVANHLADEGTKLLTAYRQQFRRQLKHTFTLAGFEAGFARAFVISNFEDCFGTVRESPDQQLTVTTRKLRAGGKATVIVTGYKPAVPIGDKRLLGALAAKYPADGGRIRRRMEALNAKAAAASRGLISQDCVVLSFRSDGSGVLQLNNEAAEVPPQFPSIIYGINVAQSMNNALRSLGVDPTQIRLVQGGFASSHSSGSASVPTASCPFAVVEPDLTSGYRIHEITFPGFDFITPNDINDSSQVVGTGQSRTQPNIPWMMQNDRLTPLNYTGFAVSINNHGQVAGTLQSEQGERATVYEGGHLTTFPLYHGEPGVFSGTDSSASAISANGTVAGSVQSRTEERGRPNRRAAVFWSGQPPTVLMELKAEFGSNAVDINARGQVLVSASPGPSVFDTRSILWTPQDGNWFYIGNHTTDVLPIALTDEGLVLGKARNNRAKPSIVIWQPGGDWERLGIDDGWEALDINNQGDVIGWAWVDRIQRPWLRLASGQIIWLPYVIEHNTIPKAINNYGQIIGSAVADHGQHAVIWQR